MKPKIKMYLFNYLHEINLEHWPQKLFGRFWTVNHLIMIIFWTLKNKCIFTVFKMIQINWINTFMNSGSKLLEIIFF